MMQQGLGLAIGMLCGAIAGLLIGLAIGEPVLATIGLGAGASIGLLFEYLASDKTPGSGR